jgi:nucleotide-binding universal stress UspA family protein
MSENSFTGLAPGDAERHILAAVDESDNSKRAIIFLADFFGRDKDVHITILSIIPEPSEDFFATEAAMAKWRTDKQAEMARVMAGYRDILHGVGFADNRITVRLIIRPCPSIADAILEEHARHHYRIIVVGRRGISHNEEFIFGSTSNKILHHATNCAVMVVE